MRSYLQAWSECTCPQSRAAHSAARSTPACPAGHAGA